MTARERREVVEARLTLARYRSRHPRNDRDSHLGRWLAVLGLREALCGEVDAHEFSRFGRLAIDAVSDGRPVWPIYAKLKRGRP